MKMFLPYHSAHAYKVNANNKGEIPNCKQNKKGNLLADFSSDESVFLFFKKNNPSNSNGKIYLSRVTTCEGCPSLLHI